MKCFSLPIQSLAVAVPLLGAFLLLQTSRAQEVKTPPGVYDYYLLNLSWSPAFCSTLTTLNTVEQAARGSTECAVPHGFVLHGLWPQNFDGTYPASCDTRPGPQDWQRYLDMTPDVSLLKHEWAKHGTCTTLAPTTFFATARQAYTSVHIPEAFRHVAQAQMFAPDAILGMFYAANPSFPLGSFALSCGHNELTAIEACFSRDSKPIACQNIRTCHANAVRVQPDASAGIVQ